MLASYCHAQPRAAFRILSSARRNLSADHAIYQSSSTDPLFNLTLEDWLFRHAPPDDPLLLIYRDQPCVVIGRNQNPWKEVNMRALRERNIPFIRRRSGGGTVYHDLGNTNYSMHLPRTSFDRHATAQVVLRAIRSLGINARVNDRNDICIGPDKVSGSAYKIVNKRAYHHGTMLISTELDTLGDLLRVDKPNMTTRGVASVRSPVCNLRQHNRDVTHAAFSDAMVIAFQEEHGIRQEPQVVNDDTEVRNIEYIRSGMEELLRWDWAYGQTPEFTYKLQKSFHWGDATAEIRTRHGIIQACDIRVEAAQAGVYHGTLDGLMKALEGARYGSLDTVALETSEGTEDQWSREIKDWLVHETAN